MAWKCTIRNLHKSGGEMERKRSGRLQIGEDQERGEKQKLDRVDPEVDRKAALRGFLISGIVLGWPGQIYIF